MYSTSRLNNLKYPNTPSKYSNTMDRTLDDPLNDTIDTIYKQKFMPDTNRSLNSTRLTYGGHDDSFHPLDNRKKILDLSLEDPAMRRASPSPPPNRAKAKQNPPLSFDQLEKEGFDFKMIDKEDKINNEMKRVGKGLLEISNCLRDTILKLKISKDPTEVSKILPDLNSKIEGRNERIEDSKKRLNNLFKVSI